MAQAPPSKRRPLSLPPEPTPFIGRAHDLQSITARLSDVRLVTLCGPPGMGKTRTALRVATDIPRAAWFCDLASATTEAALCAAVARALGATLVDDPIESVGMSIARLDQPLLVLDNFEQLASCGAKAVARWLVLAPDARFLVTSRERLRLREEHVHELSPLAQPTTDADVTTSEASRLFLDRVRSHRADYEPTAAELPKIIELVRELEGIPLAIELAAARFDALGIDGLHQRLTARLKLLSRGPRGVRQSTLRGTIDESWQLLDDPQRRAFARVSVFRGGFSVDAAEAVIGPDALDLLQDLRDRSLVRLPHHGRFGFFESIREFAAEQLEAMGEVSAAEAAHCAFFLSLGTTLAARFEQLGGPIDRLVQERDNLVAVLERALIDHRYEDAGNAALSLGPVLSTRGPATHWLELLERVTQHVPDEPRLLHDRAMAKRAVGNLNEAKEDLINGLALSPEPHTYARMRKDLGLVHHQQREIDPARACYESALLMARELGDRRLQGMITGNLGALDHDIGRFEQAAGLYAQALDMLREAGDARLEGIFWTNLGVLEQEQGQSGRARERFERALELLAQTGDSRFEAIALGSLGLLEHEAGNLDQARHRHEQALVLLEEVGDVHSEALSRARLGGVLAELGEVSLAERQLDEAERRVVGRDPLALELVRLHRCFLELASGDRSAAFARVRSAQQPRGDGLSLVDVSDDARLLLRMLAKSLAEGPGPRLEVGSEANWFKPPGGAVQSLDKFGASRRILHRLVTLRLQSPGQPVEAADLFEAGWPGVAIASESANNRLYVELARLRKMGLKLLLLRRDSGYVLDPNTPVLTGQEP